MAAAEEPSANGCELAHSYSVESNNEVKMTKQEIIEMIQRAGTRLWISGLAFPRMMPATFKDRSIREAL